MNFNDVLGTLNRVGFYDFALPLLLVFGIVFGLLQRLKLFGKDDEEAKKLNAIISIVIAFFVVNYTPFAVTLSYYFSAVFGQSAMVMSVLLIILLFMAILGFEVEGKDNIFKEGYVRYLVVIALILIAYSIFNTSYGGVLNLGISEETLTTIFTLLFIVAIIWFVSE